MKPAAHYHRDDILSALSDSGVQSGDTVFFSTSLGMLGSAAGVASQEALNQLFFECICEVLGPQGTLLVPTYSYTFGKSTQTEPAIYDPKETPAEIGPFPEFFRQQKSVVRSLDPMVSVSGLGPACERLFHNLPPTSYGADCLFARLTTTQAKCCNIGLGPNWTAFIHHADWLTQVPFRYDKLFNGILRLNDQDRPLTWHYSVRILSDASRADAHRLGHMATEAGIWQYAPLGRARIYTASYRDYFHFALEQLKIDPWLMAIGPPDDPIALEKARVDHPPNPVKALNIADYASTLARLQGLRRDTVSDSFDAALSAIAEQVPMQIHRYSSGTNCFDWVTPEKWTCRHAQLETLDGEVVFSRDNHALHVQGYSLPFRGTVSRERLFKHLHTHPAIPDAIPLRSHFNHRDWALCTSQKVKAQLAEAAYRVHIDTDFSLGELQVGEVVVPGKSAQTILLCVYLDGPGRINENLSGLIVGLDVMKRLRQQVQTPAFTTRLLVLPGPVGLAAWLSQTSLPIIAGINLQMLGHPLPFTLQKSEVRNIALDTICERLMTQWNGHLLESQPFNPLPSGGNPTCQQPVIHFPWIALGRTEAPKTLHFPFYGFGTHLDTLDQVDLNTLYESRDRVLSLTQAITIGLNENHSCMIPKQQV